MEVMLLLLGKASRIAFWALEEESAEREMKVTDKL